MKRLSAAFCIIGMLFAFAACSNQNPGGIIISQPNRITAEDVARGFDQAQFSTDVNQDLKYNNVPGLDTKMVSEKPEEIAIMAFSTNGTAADDAASATTAYIVVNFTGGYRNSETTTIESGSMLLTVEGTTKSSTFTFSSYTAETTTALAIRTTTNGRTSVDDVKITLPKSEATGKATVPSAAETEYTFGNDDGVEIKAPEQGSGATITVGTTEVPVDKISEDVAEGSNGLFAGGYGTKDDPYRIETTEQFLNIGHEDIQNAFMADYGANLYFSLENDIHLEEHKGSAARFFSGTLMGNGHRIYGGNEVDYIFDHFLEDTTFEDFTVVFDDEEITQVVFQGAILSAGEFADSEFYYDKETMVLNYNNVDYLSQNEDHVYKVRDNNFGFYADGTVVYFLAIMPDGSEDSSAMSCYMGSPEQYSKYIINITDCDVTGNFIGGFGKSGSAIFLGGQYFDTDINITDCTFDGVLEGYNTSLITANANMCFVGNPQNFPYENNVYCDNVTGVKIISYSGKGSVYYSNHPTETIAGVVNCEYETISPSNALTVTGSNLNDKLSISLANSSITGIEKYQYKLSLPTLYWYEDGLDHEETGETNSNTFTIEYSANGEAPDVYIAKPVSRIEAEALAANGVETAFANLSWDNAAVSEEGLPYQFVVNDDGAVYLVIDYLIDTPKLYSGTGIPSSMDSYKALSVLIALGLDSSNGVIATSFGETVE